MKAKQIFYKIRTNSLVRLCVYLLIEIALLGGNSFSMDYSIGYIAPLSNCLCFLFIAFEVAFFHYQFILPVILAIKIIVLVICNCFVGTLDYVIFFSCSFLLLRFSDFIIYNRYNLREFTFPLSRKELFLRKLSKYNSSFIISQLVVFTICLFTRKTDFELVIPIVFITIAIYKDFIEIKWGKISFLSYYKTTFLECIFLAATVFCIKNISVIEDFSTDIAIPVLVAVFVFNITTLFLLIQFNYNKYASTYLIRNIITIPILFLTIIIPVCIILFLGFFAESLIPDDVLVTVKFCCVAAVFVSSLLYLLFFTQGLESGCLLNSILLSVNDDDIKNNKNSIIPYDETKFDAITRIIKTDISKNDLIALRSDLYGMVYWSRENINRLRTNSNIYWEQIDNRFASFYKEIAILISKHNDSSINDIYLNSLKFIFNTTF